ncbi:hypothetical protein ISS30_09260 [bacterium]|nr:hypothetical protein [bacterium]
MNNLYKIFVIAFIISYPGFCGAGELKFSRPDNYRSFYYETISFKDSGTIDLNGAWEYRIQGVKNWHEIEIPASWSGYHGTVIFRKQFTLPVEYEDKVIKLRALGVSRKCKVRLNDDLISPLEYGGFEILLPAGSLKFGRKNQLEIVVDNVLKPLNTIPPRSGVLHSEGYGGIIGDIFLRIEDEYLYDEVYISSVLEPDLSSGEVIITVHANTDRVSADTGFDYKLISSDNKTAAEGRFSLTGGTTEYQFSVPNPGLWSPHNPILYKLEIFKAGSNTPVHCCELGFKRLSFEDNFIRLNNEPVKIKGLRYYAQTVDGAVLKAEDFESDVKLMLQAGANSILLTGMPHSYLLQLCDRRGILVFLSSEVIGAPAALLKREEYFNQVMLYIDRMISDYYQNPSIAAWGVGLDLQKSFPVSKVVSMLKQRDTRPFFIGAAGNPDKIILFLLSEGGGYHAVDTDIDYNVGVFLSDNSELSQEIQAGKISRILEDRKEADGIFLSSLKDWRADRRFLLNKPDDDQTLVRSGILDIQRQPRLAFQILQQGWKADGAGVTLQNYIGEPLIYPIAGFILLLLYLAGFRYNKIFRRTINRAFIHSHGFLTDIKNDRFIQKTHTLSAGFGVAVSLSSIVSALLFKMRLNEPLDYILAHLFKSDSLHAFLVESIWKPPFSILYIFIAVIALFLVIVSIFTISARLMRCNAGLIISANLIIWSSSCLLILLPLSIFFYKGLSYPILKWIELSICGICLVWWLFRIFGALKIICRRSGGRVVLVFLSINLAILGLILVYFQLNTALFHYWDYFFQAVLVN